MWTEDTASHGGVTIHAFLIFCKLEDHLEEPERIL
jgi:hypothetical protein